MAPSITGSDAAIGNVLRRHDGPAQMESVGAVEVADRAGDRSEIRLRNLLAEIGLIDRGDTITGDSVGAADGDAAQHELRLGIPAGVRLPDARKLNRRPAQRFPLGLVIEIFLGLARIEAGWFACWAKACGIPAKIGAINTNVVRTCRFSARAANLSP